MSVNIINLDGEEAPNVKKQNALFLPIEHIERLMTLCNFSLTSIVDVCPKCTKLIHFTITKIDGSLFATCGFCYSIFVIKRSV